MLVFQYRIFLSFQSALFQHSIISGSVCSLTPDFHDLCLILRKRQEFSFCLALFAALRGDIRCVFIPQSVIAGVLFERDVQCLHKQFVVERFAQEGDCACRQGPVADSDVVVSRDEDDREPIAAAG